MSMSTGCKYMSVCIDIVSVYVYECMRMYTCIDVYSKECRRYMYEVYRLCNMLNK